MVVLNTRLKAFTLVETMVAVIIITLSLSVGIGIYVNVSSSDNHAQKLKAQILLKNIAIDLKKESNLIDGDLEKEGVIVKKVISKFKDSEDLSILELKAFSSDGLVLAEYKEIIRQ